MTIISGNLYIAAVAANGEGPRFAVYQHNQVVFQGTYTQCLIVFGGLINGMSHAEAVKLAREIN